MTGPKHDTELFNVQYRAALDQPPVNLICQAIDVSGEKLLWIDGINVETPVLAPLSAMREICWMGSFREFAANRLDLARQVIAESQGEHSPTILARAMQYMSADASLSPAEALDYASDQALDIVDADNCSAYQFGAVAAAQVAQPA